MSMSASHRPILAHTHATVWMCGSTHLVATCWCRYVALYAKFLLVDSVRSALDAMREGLLEVVTPAVLDGLSAEDFRLILNGCAEVSSHMFVA